MMGMKRPVHILQLDASVDEIVNMTAIAVIDAQQKEKMAQEIKQDRNTQVITFVMQIILLHLGVQF